MSSYKYPDNIFVLDKYYLLTTPQLSYAQSLYTNLTSRNKVTNMLSWSAHSSIDQTRNFIRKSATENANEINHHWIIIDTQQSSQEAIGIFSLWDDAELGIELGYCLSDMYWQQGIMSTIISTVCQWLFTHPHCTRIWATCDISNIGSRKALTKAGFNYEKLLPNHTVRPNISSSPRDSLVYARYNSAAAPQFPPDNTVSVEFY